MAHQPATRLLFADEAWWGLTTEIGKVWTRGARPVLLVRGGRSWTPVLAAVEPATGRLVSPIAGRFDAAWFGHFLGEVAAAYPPERVVLVGDRAGGHTARDLVVPPTVIPWFLPPHRPERHPAEHVWHGRRDQHTRGVLCHDREELVTTLCHGLTALMDDPARVRSRTGGPIEPVDDRISA